MAEAGNPTNQLKKNTLGVAAITFMVVSAAAPLTGAGGGIPPSMLFGNGAGIAGSFAIVTLILCFFGAPARTLDGGAVLKGHVCVGLNGRLSPCCARSLLS